MTGNNTKAECSHSRALPTHYMTAFRNYALVTKDRMASPLDFTPELQELWTAGSRKYLGLEQMRSPQLTDSPSATRCMTKRKRKRKNYAGSENHSPH